MTSFHDQRIAFFNTGRSYQVSAKCLQTQENPLPCYLESSPIRVLLALAIELYLKSFLLHKNVAMPDVCRLGHKVSKALEECEALGLVIAPVDRDLVRAIQDTNIIIADRYLETGTRRIPNEVRMQEVAESLFQEIGGVLAAELDSRLTQEGLAPPRPSRD